MGAGQRIVLIATLLITATICHFTFCTWALGSTMFWNTAIVCGWSVDDGAFHITGEPVKRFYGIVAPAGERRLAVLAGVLPPLMGLGAALFLALGWRAASRRERGACWRCGYELKFDYASRCPECGWRVIP